jgi:hypothetical protein
LSIVLSAESPAGGIAEGVVGAVCEYVPAAVPGATCGRTIGPDALGAGGVVGDCAQAGIVATIPAAKANAFRVCFMFPATSGFDTATAPLGYAVAGSQRLDADFVHGRDAMAQ